MMGSHPIRILAHEECNGRDSRRNYWAPVLAVLCGFQCRGMRRQAAPSHHACQAKLIEVRGIVVRDSAREHKPFPRARRNFKALQLPDHFERAMFAPHLSTWSNVLPAKKPIHELGWCDRFNLLAQRRHRQAMDASQQTALAPLGLNVGTAALGCPGERSSPISRARIGGSEIAPQNRAASFHAEQSFLNLGSRQSEQCANL